MSDDSMGKKEAIPSPKIQKGTATFADNVLTLAGGTTIALGVTVLASPITSRLFGPEAFGLASLFRSGAVIIAYIACLRYEMAIALPKRDENAAALFSLCYLALVVVALLTTALSLVFGRQTLDYLNAAEMSSLLWLFPVYVFLIGSQLPLKYWYTRQKKFKIIAAVSILGSIPIVVAEITGGFAGFQTGENLVVFRIIGLLVAPAFFLWRLSKDDAGFIIRNSKPEAIIQAAKKYIKFPMMEIWSVLIMCTSTYAPILLLNAVFNPVVCGLYAKAFYLLYLPSIIVGLAVGQVFHQESAAAKANGKNIAGMVETVLNRMITLGTYPFALLLAISPELFGFFLGSRWIESGIYSQILMPQFFIGFLMGSIISLFGTLGKQEQNLITSAVGLVMRLSTLTFGGLILKNVHLTLVIFMVANVILALWRMSILIRATKSSAIRLLTHFAKCSAYVIPSVGPIAVMKWWIGLEAIYIIALTPIFSLIYIAFVLHNDLEFRNLFLIYWQKVRSLF